MSNNSFDVGVLNCMMDMDETSDRRQLLKYGVSKSKFYPFISKLNIIMTMDENRQLYQYLSENQLITYNNIVTFTNLDSISQILRLPISFRYINLLNIMPIRIDRIYLIKNNHIIVNNECRSLLVDINTKPLDLSPITIITNDYNGSNIYGI